jgi:hypothetical protein
MTLERHLVENTLPPEIGGRVHTPALQISKEFDATAEWKSQKQALEASTATFKMSLLKTAISIKRSEIAYLQSLFSPSHYTTETLTIFNEVLTELASDAKIIPADDGSFPQDSLPDWIRNDAEAFANLRDEFPKRAIAIAFVAVQSETAKKFKALSLKRKVDEDTEMQDSGSQNQTVDALVSRKIESLMKEYKIQTSSKLLSFSVFQKERSLTYDSFRPKETKVLCSEKSESSQATDPEGSKGSRKRQKEQKQKQLLQEVSKLDRAFRGIVQAHLRVSTCGGVESSCHTVLGSPISDLRRRDRAVVSTAEAIQFLEGNAELFIDVSTEARRLFVSKHTPVSLFELQHQLDSGVFKGPGVVIPRHLEHKLALNTKFILHHSPNLLRIHQAWPLLERSVRLRWHFRNSDRKMSKFYVPKRDWMPPQSLWNPVIEKGLEIGKELLFSQTAHLNPSDTHRSNPNLQQLRDFLQSNLYLVKITDKNLGLAVLSKDWYITQCQAMLADMSTYDSIDLDEIEYIQTEGLSRLSDITDKGDFEPSTTEYLSLSLNDSAIPEFHAIPKVHKTPWKLRPIVPSHSWFTRRASEVCDFALRECLRRKYPWVVDSTREVISAVQDKTISRQDNIWLITGDVEAFYTNVNVPETINAVRHKPGGFVTLDGYRRNDIADLLEVVMSCNCFQFNGEYFRQSSGVAMGTSCAPAFANLNLALREDSIPEIVTSIVNNENGLILYVRYIDDIFIVFKGSKSSLQSLLTTLNEKFEPFKIGWHIQSSSSATVFLDIEFFFEQGFGPIGVQSRVYRKKMNKHQYIPWSSAHPPAVKKAFIKAELTRFMNISSQEKLFEDRAYEFMESLSRRGYPADTLRRWFTQVKYEDRQISLLKKKVSGYRGLPLMLPSSYDEVWEYMDLRKVFQAMIAKWSEVDEPLPESLRGPLIKSLRRTENLFDKFSSWNKATLKALELGFSLPFRPESPRALRRLEE